MKPTTEGSNKIDIVCMSFGKEKQKGLIVEAGGEKSTIFNDSMTITTEKSELIENDTLKTEDGKIIKLSQGTYKEIKSREETKFQNGNVIPYAKIKESRKNEIAR